MVDSAVLTGVRAPHGNSRDISGLKFGRLSVVSLVRMSKKGSMWMCRCDCGGSITARIDSLTSGNTSSCGCIRREAIAASNRISIEGHRFGKLVAIESVGSTPAGSVRWRCVCDCGGEKVSTTAKLRFGRVISCGCTVRTASAAYMPAHVRAKASEYGHRRRVQASGAGGSFTAAEIDDLYRKQRGKCACCRVALKNVFHRDHIIAVANGGSGLIENIQLLCAPCNQSKGAKDPIAWAQSLGRLL